MTTLDEVLSGFNPEQVRKIDAIHQELERTLPLGALRRAVGMSQKTVAGVLGISQAAVSKIEGRSDALLSTLFAFVGALGGHASIRVDVGGRKFCVNASQDGFALEERSREHRYIDYVAYADIGNILASPTRVGDPERMLVPNRTLLGGLELRREAA